MTGRGSDSDLLACQAVCGCGGGSEREHGVPPRLGALLHDEGGLAYAPAYDAWIAACESAEDACWPPDMVSARSRGLPAIAVPGDDA